MSCSAATIYKTLTFMGCTRQDIQLVALQRSDDYRARFMAEVSAYDYMDRQKWM